MKDSALKRLLTVGLLLGLVLRIWPILSPRRLLWHWPTEDGYLTLTIARNLGRGLGMTVSDGTVLTNGTQPLATFLYAVGFALGDGSRRFGVAFALYLQLIVGVIGCWVLYDTVRRVFAGHAHGGLIAVVSSLVWYLNPVLVPHSQNCLETGLSLLLGLLVWRTWYLGLTEREGRFGLPGAVKLGLLMGLCAWGRVDAAFLMVGLGVAQLSWGLSAGRYRETVVELSIMASLAAVSIFPWLLYGKKTFGFWVPISGVSESSGGHFASNAPFVPAKLFEYVVGLVGVPSKFEQSSAAAIGFAVALVIWATLVLRAKKSATRPQRFLLLAFAVQAFGLCTYYGLFFGAPHFLSRYLAPLSVFTLPLSVLFVVEGWQRIMSTSGPSLRSRQGLCAALAACTAFGLLAFQHWRHATRALPHMHSQVVAWADAHVPEDVWVGAIQTGTLGFFHDRTLNLDGKVDVAALHAALELRTPSYIAASKLDAVIDWYGNARWMAYPPVAKTFRVAEDDAEKNLTVLVRIGSSLDASTR
jgi:hypothetical protein